MEYVLLLITVLCGAFRAIFTKVSTKEKSFYDKTKINSIVFLVGFITVLLIGFPSLDTMFQVPLGLAIIYGVGMVLAQVFLMLAVGLGSVSISGLIYNCSFIIATVFGCVYYREKISFLHIIGIILILLSFGLSVKIEKKKGGFLWFTASVLSCIFAGSLGCWQKIVRLDYQNVKLDNFMQVAFLAMFIFSVFIVLLCRVFTREQSENPNFYHNLEKDANLKQTKLKRFACIALTGVILGLMNKINVYLVGTLPSIVVFPAINGGGIVATSILSIIIFREKNLIRQKFALVIGLTGIITVALGGLVV